ncbi:MAG: two-component system response regulator, partial [Oscillospiraceae bacterium]|nr:two-component system response regulator [Oscillospiraceae bacterium]
EMPGMDDLKECCRDVVRHHHERFDGRGYPDGLVGDKISIGVQAVSLADVYDALVSVRCYKEAFDFDQAKNMILGGECGVFNPMVLESMVAVEAKMRKIYESNEAISEREIAAAEGLLQEHQISGGAENV